MTEENANETTVRGCHQVCLAKTPILPAAVPAAARPHETLAKYRVLASPRKLEKAHDSSGQTIPDLSSKILML